MSHWIPTNELRFVRCEVKIWTGLYAGEPTYTIDRENILQQKWERYESEWYEGEPEIEWRDVPVVEEE